MSGAVHLDLDGTLLDPGGVLTPDSLRAVALVRDAGLRPVVLTGRSRWAAVAVARTLGIDDVVCELGAVVVIDGEVAVAAPEALPVPRAALLDAVAGLPLQEHEPEAPRVSGTVLRSAASADAVTAALRAADLGAWWAVDNGPSHRPLDAGRPARVVHVVPAGIDKAAGVVAHARLTGLPAADCAVVGDSPADLACHAVAGRTVAVRSVDREALDLAATLALPVTAATGAAGALEAVRAIVPATVQP